MVVLQHGFTQCLIYCTVHRYIVSHAQVMGQPIVEPLLDPGFGGVIAGITLPLVVLYLLNQYYLIAVIYVKKITDSKYTLPLLFKVDILVY